MKKVIDFLEVRKKEYQKNILRLEKQEGIARKYLKDEPNRADIEDDLKKVEKLRDKYYALVEFIDELLQEFA